MAAVSGLLSPASLPREAEPAELRLLLSRQGGQIDGACVLGHVVNRLGAGDDGAHPGLIQYETQTQLGEGALWGDQLTQTIG